MADKYGSVDRGYYPEGVYPAGTEPQGMTPAAMPEGMTVQGGEGYDIIANAREGTVGKR
ncbi:hypothetical protein [Nocardia niigatensis]